MIWKYKRSDHGKFGTVPLTILKIKCPSCKKKSVFRRIDVGTWKQTVYCEGDNIPLYRCDECEIVIARGNQK